MSLRVGGTSKAQVIPDHWRGPSTWQTLSSPAASPAGSVPCEPAPQFRRQQHHRASALALPAASTLSAQLSQGSQLGFLTLILPTSALSFRPLLQPPKPQENPYLHSGGGWGPLDL